MRWTEEELDILYSQYPKRGSEIPELDRSRESIRKKAYKEGIEYDHTTEVKCYTCDDVFEIRDSRVDDSEKHFCDRDCKSNWDEERFSGSNHPRYGVDVDESVKNKISSSLTGENHPMWKGGGKLDYGSSWSRKREQRLKKDNHRCQNCGMAREKHVEEYNLDLNVHHIIPLREFENGDEANRISNLVTLCIPCHRKADNNIISLDN